MRDENGTIGQWKTSGEEFVQAEGTRTEGARGMKGAEETSGERTTAGGGGRVLLAGRYRVVKGLGEGGMGSVWLAEDVKLDGRKVAIKMLPSVLAGKKGAVRQVKAEAVVAMKLSHPNIATVRAFEEDEGGNPFLVMDYIEGEGLDEILAERGALDEEETRKVLGPIAAALDYAHGQGVVHRDVKPGNVLVRKDGTPFMLDFGIAREIQETLTRVTGKLSSGTLLYMSPEQLRGKAPKAVQDVYSFAATAYECLTGHPPFSRGQIEWQIVNETPEALPEGVGAALREGVMAGLAKEAGERPGSCSAVLAGAAEPERKRRDAVGPVPDAGDKGNPAAEAEVLSAEEEAEAEEKRNRALAEMRLAVEKGFKEERDAWKKRVAKQTAEERDAKRRAAIAAAKSAWAARAVPTVFLIVFAGIIWASVQLWGAELMSAFRASRIGKTLWPEVQAETGLLPAGTVAGETAVIPLGEGVTMEMAWCPPGRFTMGSPSWETGRKSDETQHGVTLTKGFWMAKTEVTQQQWEKVMGHNPSHFKGDDLPVEQVSWVDCQEFCRKTGLQIPTEAQWEYACRAGSEGAYAGTGQGEEMGWMGENTRDGTTHPVGKKRPNAWGLFDMHGNVWEWCADWYGDYPERDLTDPEGTPGGKNRVIRGGCSWYVLSSSRSACRYRASPTGHGANCGFRPVARAKQDGAGTGRDRKKQR